MLADEVPPDWPPEAETPPLFSSYEDLLRESPDLLVVAGGVDGPEEVPPGCQVLEVEKSPGLVGLLELLSRTLLEGRRIRGELQEIAAICSGAEVVEPYSDPLPKLSQLLDRAMALSGCEGGMILFPGDQVDALKVVLARGKGAERIVGGTLSISRSTCGRAFDEGIVLQKTIGPEDEEHGIWGEEGKRGLLALPIRSEGRAVGILALMRGDEGFPVDHLPTLTLVADQAGLAMLIARLYSELETNVVKDSASGLYNRNYFLQRLHEEISRARRYSLNVCLVFLRLDDFEGYVRRNGRLLADLVISDMGSIISRNTREVDTAARYEDHTFALLLPETRRLGAVRLAERIRKVVEEYPFPSREKKEVEILTICAGIAAYPANADSEETLLKKAIAALSAAAAEGPNQIRLYTEELG